MQVSSLSLHDYGNIIFALCIEEEAAFIGHFTAVTSKFGMTTEVPENCIDRRELMIAYLWLAQHILQDQGRMAGELEHHYFSGLQTHHLFREIRDKSEIEKVYRDRAEGYEKIAKLSANPADLVDVTQPICRNIFRAWPETEVHLPRLGMIMTHLMTDWIVTVTRTIDELSGTSAAAEAKQESSG